MLCPSVTGGSRPEADMVQLGLFLHGGQRQYKRGRALATTELLVCYRSGGRHIFRVEFGDAAAPHADERL